MSEEHPLTRMGRQYFHQLRPRDTWIIPPPRGMSLVTLEWLLKEIQKTPGEKVVYLNFDIPPDQRKIIEKYATIKRVNWWEKP